MNVLIKQLPKEERPRERLLSLGEQQLSNEELIAIILKTGSKNTSVKQLATNILKEIDTINNLNDLTINKLTRIKGIGKTKASCLKAALELGKRVNSNNKYINNIKINNSKIVFNLIIDDLINKKQEYFYCLYLDNKKHLISKRLLYIGTINASIVHPREIFKEAYLLSASSIICIHNHPSNNPSPSDEDIELTKNLVKIGLIQGIPIVDHIIITNNNYYSFYENNNI
jgi:DNA repair protein RadC